MIHEYLQPLMQHLHNHPHWGGAVAFITAFIESLAIIGTVVPGALTMTAIGVLIGTNTLPAGPTIFLAVAGAYAGDCISYWAGAHYDERLRQMWPFYKYPQLIEKGQAFFKLHGGKSVLIGRFAGPMRSLVPLIAGLLHMRPMRFLPIALFSAFLWAIVYITPGILLGALSLELPPSIATKFIVLCLFFLAFLWFLTWLIKFFFDQAWNQIDRSLVKLWNYLNIHKSSHWITQLLRNPKHDEDHQQLVRAVFIFVFLALFVWVIMSVVAGGVWSHLNLPLFNLFQSAHIKIINNFMIAMTLLGDNHVLLIIAVIVLIWLCWRRRWWSALHWFGIIAVSTAIVEIFKYLVHSRRPPLPNLPDLFFNVPSGHTLISVTLFGFLAVLIADNLPRDRRSWVYITAISLIFLITLSRVYLGVHWLTDVMASVFLGLFLILITTLSYRRKNLLPIPASTLIMIFVVSTFIAWIGYSYFNFSSLQQSLITSWPIQEITENNWWHQTAETIPSYRSSRTGHPAQPLNIQWYGSLDEITTALTQKGWQAHPSALDLTNTINRLGLTKHKSNLPIIPSLYHDRAPKLFIIKQLPNQMIVMLRLWQSDIIINNGETPLWLGTVTYYPRSIKLLKMPKKSSAIFDDAIATLIPDLKEQFKFKELDISPAEQPVEMKNLYWDGKLLLIRGK